MDKNTPTIYLDFDGVLHDDDVYLVDGVPTMKTLGRALFEWASVLDDSLVEFPMVQIILSTSWATVMSCEKAASFLPPSLQRRVIGYVRHRASGTPRGVVVCNDANCRGLTNWFAIDNDDAGWPARYRQRLLKTNDRAGLSDGELSISLFMMLVMLTGDGS